MDDQVRALVDQTDGLALEGDDVVVTDADALRAGAASLARAAVFGSASETDAARWVIRRAGAALGIHPASIHHYYIARGRGTHAGATTPAINIRTLTFDIARAVFRAANARDVGALIFEIARSEIGYTAQRPAEYSACVTAAAIAEGFRGPLFIQGDHFQINAKKYAADADSEVGAVKALIDEALAAGFYNVDVDTSTLVDLSKDGVDAQQALNASLSADLTLYIREQEPEGITSSIGGEIGEVGKTNSTPEELRAYMNAYNARLAEVAAERGEGRPVTGLSKISIQTGTSHGGVVLPDGSLAQVAIDFECLRTLGEIGRNEYGLGGAVQHGASTLPPENFDAFSKADAVEVHLATHFQNMVYDADEFPAALRDEIYAHLDAHLSGERKDDMTDEQFHYKLRKKGLGPFKQQIWDLPAESRDAICGRLEATFGMLFDKLSVGGTRAAVQEHTPVVDLGPGAVAAVQAAPDDTSLDD